MDNNWIEFKDCQFEQGAFYELCFWQRTVRFVDGYVQEGRFIHQGVKEYDNGFQEDGYWLRPTPTHVKKIELTTPNLKDALANESIT